MKSRGAMHDEISVTGEEMAKLHAALLDGLDELKEQFKADGYVVVVDEKALCIHVPVLKVRVWPCCTIVPRRMGEPGWRADTFRVRRLPDGPEWREKYENLITLTDRLEAGHGEQIE